MLRALRLRPETRVIVTCVAKDRWIEALYARRREVLRGLKRLEPVAVTVPNFSFVRHSPRTNSIWNQTKGFRVIEDMAEAGLPTVPHLQAQTIRDWERLAQLFERFPDCRYACMEFQTGLRAQDRDYPARENYRRNFEDFHAATGGRIHPIVLAGYCEIKFLSGLCPSVSILDANVFVKTMKRRAAIQIPGGRRLWRKAHPSLQRDLAALLAANIDVESDFLFRHHGLGPDGRPVDPLLLPAA
jgi:hypothetical protein